MEGLQNSSNSQHTTHINTYHVLLLYPCSCMQISSGGTPELFQLTAHYTYQHIHTMSCCYTHVKLIKNISIYAISSRYCCCKHVGSSFKDWCTADHFIMHSRCINSSSSDLPTGHSKAWSVTVGLSCCKREKTLTPVSFYC